VKNMKEIVGDVVETLNGMIHNGVEGEAIASDSQYEVRLILIDKTKPKHYRDPKWLYDEYVVGDRTMADIGMEFGISAAAVNQWLNKFDIPTRGRGHRDSNDSN